MKLAGHLPRHNTLPAAFSRTGVEDSTGEIIKAVHIHTCVDGFAADGPFSGAFLVSYSRTNGNFKNYSERRGRLGYTYMQNDRLCWKLAWPRCCLLFVNKKALNRTLYLQLLANTSNSNFPHMLSSNQSVE